MEMPAMQMHKRLMSLVGKIHLSRIKRPERLRDEDWPSITEAVEMLRQCVFDINDQSGLNITQLRAKARALRRRRGKLGCLMVDYLSLMDGLDPRARARAARRDHQGPEGPGQGARHAHPAAAAGQAAVPRIVRPMPILRT
jgi:replicative DNA helicase